MKFQFYKILLTFTVMLAQPLQAMMVPEPIEIKSYSYEKDKEFILDAFKKDWYWLILSSNFSVNNLNNILEKQLLNQLPLNIKILLKNNETAGFIIYYKNNSHMGHIMSIYVDQKYRNKGLAKKLIMHALKDLKKLNISTITVITRIDNNPAISVYKKVGFFETEQTSKIVFLAHKTHLKKSKL